MIDLKPTKARLKHHFAINAKFYILFPLIVFAVLNLAFSVTAPRTPANQKLDIIILGYANSYGVEFFKEDLLAALPEDQVEINVEGVSTSGSDEYDYQIVQYLWNKTAMGEGDIIIFPAEHYLYLLQQSLIDLTPYIEEGRFQMPEGVDARTYYTDTINDEEYNVEVEEGIYALPLDGLEGIIEITDIFVYDENGEPKEMKLAIGVLYYSENIENAVSAIQWIFENKVDYNPDYIEQPYY